MEESIELVIPTVAFLGLVALALSATAEVLFLLGRFRRAERRRFSRSSEG